MSHLMKLDEAAHTAQLFGSLANPVRIQVLCALKPGELTVTELLQQVDVNPTALSNHLTKLKRHGLVSCRREHRHLYYSIKDTSVLSMITSIHQPEQMLEEA